MEQELTADEDITRYPLCNFIFIRLFFLSSCVSEGQSVNANESGLWCLSPGLQGPRLQGLRQHTQGAMASLPPTTASAGSTSTCLPASCWIWPSLCPLRVCLSSRCVYSLHVFTQFNMHFSAWQELFLISLQLVKCYLKTHLDSLKCI